MAPPRVLIFGASGYTGRALVERAREEGIDTVAHLRPGSPRAASLREHFEALGATVEELAWGAEEIGALIARVAPTHVFALLGTTRKRAAEARKHGRDASYEAVDRDLSLMALEACRASDARPRFIYLSAAGVSEHALGTYLRVRATVEDAVRNSGLEWIIARPAMVSGSDREESRPGERIASRVSDAVLDLVAAFGAGSLRDRYASLDAAALAAGLLAHALDPDASARIVDAEALRDPPARAAS